MRDAERTEVYWSQEELDLAAKLFTDENRKNGAKMPGGFGFLRYEDRCKWYSKARSQINSQPERFN